MRKSSSFTGSPALGKPESVLMAPTDLGWVPTVKQQKVKSNFWARYREDPVIQPDKLTAAEVTQLCGTDVSKWWSDPGFRAWFINADSWRHQLEFLADSFLEKAMYRLLSDELSDKDFINLGKLISEMAGRMPTKGPGTVGEKEKQLTPEQAQKLFHEAALSQGYELPEKKK